MSGIAGIIHFDGRPVEPGQVEAMTAAMHYRGPDGINHWRRGNVALGQCMLRTTPESLEETQPLTNEDESLVLVMDGRVDNWEELRRELLGKGAVLRTRADAELVLRAYEVWGRDCLPHIDGDFALVIWDARRQEAFCARDRVGNKPFNYHWNGRTLVFASELHTILALPWVAEVLNQDTLAEYLGTEWYSLDETLWQGVLRLKPAHCMVAKGQGGLRLQRYWVPDLQPTLPCRTDEDYIEYYRALFTDVVRRMSRSLAPAGLRGQRRPGFIGHLCRGRNPAPAGAAARAGPGGLHAGFQRRPGCRRNGLRPRRGHPSGADHPRGDAGPHAAGLVPGDGATLYREFPDYPNGAMGFSIAEAGAVERQPGTDQRHRWRRMGRRVTHCITPRRSPGGAAVKLLAMLQRNSREVGCALRLRSLLRHGVFPLLPYSLQRKLRQSWPLSGVGAARSAGHLGWHRPCSSA